MTNGWGGGQLEHLLYSSSWAADVKFLPETEQSLTQNLQDRAALCPVLEGTGYLTPAFQSLSNGKPQFSPHLGSLILNEFSGPWKNA